MTIEKVEFHRDDTTSGHRPGDIVASQLVGQGLHSSEPIAIIQVEQGIGNVLVMTHAQARALAEAILAQLAAEGS